MPVANISDKTHKSIIEKQSKLYNENGKKPSVSEVVEKYVKLGMNEEKLSDSLKKEIENLKKEIHALKGCIVT